MNSVLTAPSASQAAHKHTGRIRVVVIEDHAMVRDGLVAMLRQEPDMEVCGTAARSEDAISLVEQNKPDVAVLDMFLEHNVDSTALIRRMRERASRTRVLVLSMHREQDVAERAARAGAHGFISKAESTDKLVDAIRAICTGGHGFSAETRARLLDQHLNRQEIPALAHLTPREMQIFRLIGTGLGLTDIAERLDLSPKTVAAHRENLKNKLTCQTAGALARQAREWLGAG